MSSKRKNRQKVQCQKLDYEVKQAKISRRSKFEGDIKSFYRVQNFYEPVDKILIEPEVSLQMISS